MLEELFTGINMEKSIGFFDILHSQGSFQIKFQKVIDFLIGNLWVRLFRARIRHEIDEAIIKSILVIRPGGIGDGVFLLKILSVFKKQYPSVDVHVVCQRRNAEVFNYQDCVQRVYVMESLNDFISLRRCQYDLIIDTEQWHFLSGVLTCFLNSKLVVGFASRPYRDKLFHNPIPYDVNAYELINFRNLFISVFKSMGNVENLDGGYKVSQEHQVWARQLINAQSVIVSLGGSILGKRFTLEQNCCLLDILIGKGFKPILVGGEDVSSLAQAIISMMGNQVKSYVGKSSLSQTAALIERSVFFIGVDSGVLHLARSVGVKTIGFFGPGNIHKWARATTKDVNYSKFLACSPCTLMGYALLTCGGKVMCMRDIPFQDILKDM